MDRKKQFQGKMTTRHENRTSMPCYDEANKELDLEVINKKLKKNPGLKQQLKEGLREVIPEQGD